MDSRFNPYTPNAGARPPALVGREDQIEAFEVLLGRLSAGYTEQSLMVVGLRGVGKTVLLGEFRRLTLDQGWKVVEIEVAEWTDEGFRREVAREVRRVIHSIAPREKWADRTKRAARLLKSFTVSIDHDGTLTVGLEGGPIKGYADSGDLDADLADLMIGLGEAAREQETGVVFLLDEVHFLQRGQMVSLIGAIHRTVQRALPITVAAAGLPHVHELVGEAKTYAERLFTFPQIGRLADADAARVLSEPARARGAVFSRDAISTALDFTEGYPYFLQEFGKAVWNIAPGPDISGYDAEIARALVEDSLDSGFFRVRLDRATELQRAYLRAMADLGPQPQPASSVAKLLGRTSQQCGGIRKQLIDKGLLYTPDYGYAAFTVPKFDQFLKRAIPDLRPWPVRKRRPSD